MRAILFLMFSSLGAIIATSAYGANLEKFAVYYSDKAPIESFNTYQLLVLDSTYHPSLQALNEDGKTLLGYISLGESEKNTPYHSMLKEKGLLLKENKYWKGSHFIDIRDPLWQKTVIEEIIPKILHAGFNGVFFDTLDSPLELERVNPKKYSGMRKASIQLIQAIRLHYPSLKIMVNRAYSILPEVTPYIDMVLGESMLGDYNFDDKLYHRVEEPLYLQQVKWLKEAKDINPQLKVYTLDYANNSDKKAIADIYRMQRNHGFIPYVASIQLDELIDEPSLVASGT